MIATASLIFAAALLIFAGAVHSHLAEKYLFPRLFRLTDLPRFRNDRLYTERVLRFAWHITSLAWFGFAAILLMIAAGMGNDISLAVAVCVGTTGIVILITCGRRHPAWMVFLMSSALIFLTRLF